MKRTNGKSVFVVGTNEYIKDLQDKGNVILQAGIMPEYKNYRPLLLLETMRKEDFEKISEEGQLQQAREEIEKQNERIKLLEQQLETEHRYTSQKVRENEKLGDFTDLLQSALLECQRVFGELPKEIQNIFYYPTNENFGDALKKYKEKYKADGEFVSD